MIRLAYRLARLYGVQTVYHDAFHHRRRASVEALLAVLQSLGAPVATLQDIPSAWRERQQAQWQRTLEPVTVAWDGEPTIVHLRLPSAAETTIASQLTLESGEQDRREWQVIELPTLETAEVEGIKYVIKQLSLPRPLPWGYHRLSLELAGGCEETLIISAPLKAYASPQRRVWGGFLPLYALQTQKSWGSGDLSDLGLLMTWVVGMGGGVIATLPLLPIDINSFSPYLPLSRLMWNEFYLDISKIPELKQCPSAQALLGSPSLCEGVESLRNSSLIDYRRQMALRRQVLEELCRCLFAEPSERLDSLHQFAQNHPVIADYARFRATWEREGLPWRSWRQPLRDGVLNVDDYEEENMRYHLYVQWLANEQIGALSQEAGEKRLQLYFDLPLGVHPDGYDVWRERRLFALGVSTGAPPDAVFTTGQNWHSPPLHPERIREESYSYFIACLHHHLRQGKILRIDHVMGLHRLCWIPDGMNASQGVYVRYPFEELYAILALESHRHQAVLVGEDLGTVSPEVRPAMRRHGLYRTYVAQYETVTNHRRTLRPVPANCIASLNTHDMPPFAAFWQGLDNREAVITFLCERGWLKEPTADTGAILRAFLSFLSASRAWGLLVNLEDLWLETRPQNIPGTTKEYPNWQRKAGYSFETFCQMPQVIDTLKIIDHLRRQGRQR